MLSCVDDFQMFFVFCKAEFFPLQKTEAQNGNRFFLKELQWLKQSKGPQVLSHS